MSPDLELDEELDQVLAEPRPGHEDRLLAHELRTLRARERAREILAAERRGPLPEIDAGMLDEVLARPPEPPSRINELIPWSASTLLTAQRKTGKTTLVLNLARSLLTGEDFLGRFAVQPLSGPVAMLNYEVSAAQLARWAREVGVPGDRLYLVNLRGWRNPLNDAEDRGALASRLRALGVETVVCDPFGRAYSGASQNDAGEVGGWLTRLDQWARGDVGARDLVLTAHAGWNGERTRGSTALEDWADVILTLTRDDAEDATGERYLRALGRDVDLEEDRLMFDPATRGLSLAGAGSRQAARSDRRIAELRTAVLAVVQARPGIKGAEVERQLRDQGVTFQRGQERQALGALVEGGQLACVTGARNAKHYSASPVSPASPQPPHGDGGEPPQPPYMWGGSPGVARRSQPPRRGCSAESAAKRWPWSRPAKPLTRAVRPRHDHPRHGGQREADPGAARPSQRRRPATLRRSGHPRPLAERGRRRACCCG